MWKKLKSYFAPEEKVTKLPFLVREAIKERLKVSVDRFLQIYDTYGAVPNNNLVVGFTVHGEEVMFDINDLSDEMIDAALNELETLLTRQVALTDEIYLFVDYEFSLTGVSDELSTDPDQG